MRENANEMPIVMYTTPDGAVRVFNRTQPVFSDFDAEIRRIEEDCK